jgi:leader peptidase (prepilin peptidase)/N-methyltransferase
VPEQFVAFYLVCLGAFGLLFGSFANVLVWRVPRGESIVSPGSHCPKCGHPIRWYDNIPVVSWLALGRRCRDCGEPISWRYPAVELASGALWVIAGWRWGFSTLTPLAIVFFYMLLVLAVVDIDTRRLPTPLVSVIAIAAVLAVAASLATGLPFGPLTGTGGAGWPGSPAVVALAGLALGAGVAIGIATAYGRLRGREGLGFGDVRLLGAMGLVLGPYVLLAYALANIFGVFGAIPALLAVRRHGPDAEDRDPDTEGDRLPLSIPFGPFLGLAGVITALAGPAMWAAYLRLLGAA